MGERKTRWDARWAAGVRASVAAAGVLWVPAAFPPAAVLAQTSAVAPTARFTDVAADAAARPAIESLVAQGIMRGVSATQFAPDEPETLGDFAVSMQKLFALPPPAEPVPYTDVVPGSPYYAAVEALTPHLHYQLLCPGCALTSTIQPDQPVSRAAASVALVSILAERKALALPSASDADQVLAKAGDAADLPARARPYFAAAISSGLLPLTPQNAIAPRGTIRRADTAVLLDGVQTKYHLAKIGATP
jgi:hypothetical protein